MKLNWSTNKNQHEGLEDGMDDHIGDLMRVEGSIRALKHINNLSDKQLPVFKELEEDYAKAIASAKKNKADLRTHAHDTDHLDVFAKIWLVGKWFIAAAVTLALTKPLWINYM